MLTSPTDINVLTGRVSSFVSPITYLNNKNKLLTVMSPTLCKQSCLYRVSFDLSYLTKSKETLFPVHK